jgi:diguanylate cyclase (GGDEF)-like protein/PAS domain S-box-containing protein
MQQSGVGGTFKGWIASQTSAVFSPPKQLLARIRWLFLVCCLVAGLIIVWGLTIDPSSEGTRRVVAGSTLVLLCAWWILCHERGRFPVGSVIFEAASLCVIGITLEQPHDAFLLTSLGLAFRSLYGKRSDVVRSVVAFGCAQYVTIAAGSPSFDPLAGIVAFLHQFPQLVMWGTVMHVLGAHAGKHEEAALRQKALATAGAALVAANTAEDIYRATTTVLQQLLEPYPGTAASIAIGDAAAMNVVGSTRRHPHIAPAGVLVMNDVPEEVLGALVCGHPLHYGPAEESPLQKLFDPRNTDALSVLPLTIQQQLRGVIAIAGPQRLDKDMHEALHDLASKVSLAIESADLSEDLHRSERRFRSLVQNASDVIAVADAGGNVLYISPAISTMLGYAPEDLIGTFVFDLVHPDDTATAQRFLLDVLTERRGSRRIEVQARHVDGSWRRLTINGTNMVPDQSVGGVVINIRDITETTTLEEQLKYQAYHDPLTKLPNRTLFRDRLQNALDSGTTPAVLFLDLDDFKAVNDSMGHAVGDELLIHVAQRLMNCLRPDDIAARLGGDEFAVLVEDASSVDDASRVAERIIEMLARSFRLHGKELSVHGSVGVATTSDHNDTADTLLRDADVAMYMAKGRGKARYEIYEPAMREEIINRLQLRADLEHAIERKEFSIHYQPTVELVSGVVTGLEALLRWDHPVRGMVPPSEFIPIAEESGLILPIGTWVLREASKQVRAWQERFDEELSISVNLSAAQLQQSDLVEEVAHAVQDGSLDPHSLVLEITESLLMYDMEETKRKLARLRGLGVRVAIDDFGTGFSSLSYLHRFPVDVLKVDKSFIDDISRDAEKAALARAIIKLAETLNLETVAEGIEDEQQADYLRMCGCRLGQGYFFTHPLDRQAMELFLSEYAIGRDRSPERGDDSTLGVA